MEFRIVICYTKAMRISFYLHCVFVTIHDGVASRYMAILDLSTEVGDGETTVWRQPPLHTFICVSLCV